MPDIDLMAEPGRAASICHSPGGETRAATNQCGFLAADSLQKQQAMAAFR
jgi:hypothetical protein